jgi:hypothetical protein
MPMELRNWIHPKTLIQALQERTLLRCLRNDVTNCRFDNPKQAKVTVVADKIPDGVTLTKAVGLGETVNLC